jgi:iron complex outermembrane receptor protein
MELSGETRWPDRGAIAGRVTFSQGDPVVHAVVMITGTSPSHSDIAALTDEQGKYSFRILVPGTYTLLVNAEGYDPQTRQIKVRAGDVAQLDFILQ